MSFHIGHTSGFSDKQATPTERYCMGCHSWYEGKFRVCPECDLPKTGFNKHLRIAHLNNALYQQAERAR